MRGIHLLRTLVAAALVAAVLLVPPALAAAGRTAPEDEIANTIVAAINAERAARGLPALHRASDTYAQERARLQPDRGTDGHQGFHAKTAARELGLQGGPWSVGEALFWSNRGKARDPVVAWMGSDSHRHLILHPDATVLSVGISCRDGESMHAVTHVGASASGQPPSTTATPTVTSKGGRPCEMAPAPKPPPPPPPAPEPAQHPPPKQAPKPTPKPKPRKPSPTPAPPPAPAPQAQETPELETVTPEPTVEPTASTSPSPTPSSLPMPKPARAKPVPVEVLGVEHTAPVEATTLPLWGGALSVLVALALGLLRGLRRDG